MKKFLTHISLAIFLNILLINSAWAEINTPPEGDDSYAIADSFMSDVNDDIKNLPACIDRSFLERGYTVTFIEEPLYIQESVAEINAAAGEEAAVIYKLCYRHTFQYILPSTEERIIVPHLSGAGGNGNSNCSQAAIRLIENTGGPVAEFKPSYSCKEIQVILAKVGGTKLLYGYIGLIYRWVSGIAGLITVVVVVGSSIQIAASGGNSEAISSAKTRIIQSVSGLALLFLAGLLLNTINPTFFTR